jgi:hemolysin III
VENLYPILEEKQYDASFFPWYSLFGFALVATPILIVFQWLLPKAPIFLGGYLAVALSLALYEILHAIEHLPLEKWQPLLDHPRFGNFWKKVYAFHLRHHADKKSNESISGFFGLPIPDFVFRTWVNPMTLYEHGKPNSEQEFSSPRPVFLIRWLDTLAEFRKRRFKEAQR